MVKDPVCGMDVDPKKAKAKGLTLKKDKTYYFCSQKCLDEFKGKKSSPVFIEITISLALIAVAIIVSLTGVMLQFMGIVFLILAFLKLIDIKGFASMFSQYDLIAKKSKAYSFIYPFIELALGIMYLFAYQIKIAAVVTILVMGIGAIGVGKNIFSKNKIKCACLGAKIKVPLTRFTLVEDIVMAIMGVGILIFL